MKISMKERIFQLVNGLIFTLFAFLCIYPFYYLFINSLSDPVQSAKGLVILYPKGFTLENYTQILKLDGIASAFFISASRAVIGTIIQLFFSSMFAFVLTKNQYRINKFLYRAMVITMYMSAGIIPWFVVMKSLGLANNYLLYILPGAVAPFSVILIKTYMENISPFLEESASIDGAGVMTIFLKIILPVCQPVLMAVAVFGAVGQWNPWQDNFFLVKSPHLQTLQMMLMNVLKESESLTTAVQNNADAIKDIAAQSNKMTPFAVKTTITMVATIPIICVYPFLQKYFVSGIMIGAVKG